ncbi:MAG: response regulator [Anaerolineae bacterium]|nr:response regulator [Anaerolineae bacterium]
MSIPLALVIEDDVDLSMIFSKAVSDAGYKVEVIADGEAAERRLKAIVPDLVFLDLHLPGIDGGELLKRIRADDRLSDTFIMVASADSAFTNAVQDKADLTLVKPVSYQQLNRMAQRIRARKQK